jgi:hypothetical protein
LRRLVLHQIKRDFQRRRCGTDHTSSTRRTKARKIKKDDDDDAAATATWKNGNVGEEQEEQPDPPNVLSRDPNAVMYGVQPPDPSKSKPL